MAFYVSLALLCKYNSVLHNQLPWNPSGTFWDSRTRSNVTRVQTDFAFGKAENARQIQYGVMTYMSGKATTLVADLSRTGIGYALMQNKCRCMRLAFNCCNTGWWIVYIESRFFKKG